jgi:hypothetical protein
MTTGASPGGEGVSIPFSPGEMQYGDEGGVEGYGGASLGGNLFREQDKNPADAWVLGESQGGVGIGGFASDYVPLTPDQIKERYPQIEELPPETQDLLNKLLSGSFTPEELLDALRDPALQAVYDVPGFGPVINPLIEAATNAALRQAEFAKEIELAEIAQTYGLSPEQAFQLREITAQGSAQDVGALLAAGGSADQIRQILQARADSPAATAQFAATPFGALSNAGAEITDLQNALRIQAAGGLTDEEDILQAQLAQFNPFAETAEQRLARARAEASGGLTDELNIMAAQTYAAANNPFAAAQMGQDIGNISTILRGGLTAEEQRKLALANQAGQMQGNFLNFIGNPYAVGAARTFGSSMPAFNAQQLQQISDSPSGMLPGFLTGLNDSPFTLPATESVGGARGLGENFTMGQFEDLSETEQGSVTGQLAGYGIAPDQLQERARSFTPGTTQTVRQYA